MAQPPAGRSVRSGKTGWAKYGVALVLLIGLIAFVQLRGGPTPGVAPAAEEAIAPSVSVSVAPPTSAAPIESPVVVEPPKAATIDVVPAAPSAALNIETVASTAPSVVPNADLDQVVVVQGDSPAKSADFVFVTCGEPCLLQKKKREGPGEGTRVEVAQGARKRIAISSGEILRVARGQDVDIFYQGRKVAPRLVQTGVWMSFVPRSDDGTGK
jgi:hypothetical protein